MDSGSSDVSTPNAPGERASRRDDKIQIQAGLPLAIANLKLDSSSPLPIHEQICQGVRTAVWSQQLPPGTLLPTSRELAQHLGVSRNTVVFAYARLVDEGICVSNTRRGTRIASDIPSLAHAPESSAAQIAAADTVTLSAGYNARHALETAVHRVHGGVPFALLASDPVLYPRTKLGRRLADKFLGAPPAVQLSPQSTNSVGHFQKSIAAYLRQARGVICDPEQIMAVSGVESALSLAARVLLDPGDSVAVEDPAMDVVHSAFSLARANIYPIPSDAHGADPAQMKGPPARLIYVSPSVGFPFGAQMSEERRLKILAAARAQNAIVLECDIFGELRYAGARIKSLQGLDTDGRVIHCGGFLETLGPFVNVGYLVIPKSLYGDFAEIGRRVMAVPPPPVLDAIAEFIDEHEYSTHARNVRSVFAERLDVVKQACKYYLPSVRVSEPLGGLHVVLQWGQSFDEVSVAEAAMAEGLPVCPLSRHALQNAEWKGLVFAFGAVSDQSVQTIIKRLGQIVYSYNVAHSARDYVS